MIAFCPRFEQCNVKAIVRPDGGIDTRTPGNPRKARQHNPERQRSLIMADVCSPPPTWPTKRPSARPNPVDDCRAQRGRQRSTNGEPRGASPNRLSAGRPSGCLAVWRRLPECAAAWLCNGMQHKPRRSLSSFGSLSATGHPLGSPLGSAHAHRPISDLRPHPVSL